MPSCLGLFIDTNLIKYAKISKDRNITKVESFGIKFYDKLGDAIKQIIEETYSYKIPISVNLSDEVYNYFYMFNMLNQNDLKKAIATEFESYCFDKGININAFETRYSLVENVDDKEKVKVIHVSANRAEIARKEQQLEGYKISALSPLPMALPNLLDIKAKENIAIVNIESKTTITTIVDEKVYDIKIIEQGAQEILDRINTKENSYSKAYEICKGSTIYTLEGKELQEQENEYLEDIMPTLYNIVTQVKEILTINTNRIDKVYITGTASVINNIDLYFQEYLGDINCEILKPYFVNNQGVSINIKDYVEVNSAIALGLQGVGDGLKAINFKKPAVTDSLPSWLKVEIGGNKSDKQSKTKESKFGNFNFRFDLGEKLDRFEKNLLRTCVSILTIVVMYSGFSIFLTSQITDKQAEADEVIQATNQEISKVNSDINLVRTRTNDYTRMIENLQEINQQIAERYQSKDAIPNLLSQIMSVIPQTVKITSIKNTSGKQIEIKAESKEYQQLGYFKAKLKTDGILLNITSDSGVKQDNIVKVTIKGELP